jgi:Zn-finger nucleic acid-binding protein
MVKVTKIGEAPTDDLQCSRGCGNLRYGRTFQYRGKTNNCKNCSGVMLNLDELNTLENKGIKRFNKLKKNKLRETLSTGKAGSLDCPKCRKIMVEIELFYKRGRYMAKQDEATLKSVTTPNLGNLVSGIPIIGGFFTAVVVTADLAADLKHGKLDKSVTIDACPSCFIFWFDKKELGLISMNDVTVKKENSSVKVAPPNTQSTQGVVTASKSEVERKD